MNEASIISALDRIFALHLMGFSGFSWVTFVTKLSPKPEIHRQPIFFIFRISLVGVNEPDLLYTQVKPDLDLF